MGDHEERRLKNAPVTNEVSIPISLLNAREALLRDYVMCVGCR